MSYIASAVDLIADDEIVDVLLLDGQLLTGTASIHNLDRPHHAEVLHVLSDAGTHSLVNPAHVVCITTDRLEP